MMRKRVRIFCIACVIGALLGALAGCRPSWEFRIEQAGGGDYALNPEVFSALADFVEEVDARPALPLERLLVVAGHRGVDRVALRLPPQVDQEWAWQDIAGGAWVLRNGTLRIGRREYRAGRVDVEPGAWLADVQVHIADVAPTVAQSLGIPAPSGASGIALDAPGASRALILLLDGLGYVRYEEALAAGLLSSLPSLGIPLVGLTSYPPATAVSTASLLTGAEPAAHGVTQRGIRTTTLQTLFDVAAEHGRRTVAVEGNALAFNLRHADIRLSSDDDSNDSTDDNVLANALAVLEEGMPELLFVHFHGIDDAGHTYGPGAPQEERTIREVDRAAGQLIAALPAGTLIVVLGDHGMHAVTEEGRLGNHGHLIERDMLIPVIVTAK